MEERRGYVSHIVYRNVENGYTVFELENPDEDVEETCVGNVPFLNEGEYVCVRGELVTHPIYQEQLKVMSCEVQEPDDELAMLRYLSSGAIAGVRGGLAKRIVDKFGDKTFEIIEKEPERLAEVKGITEKKARAISEQFEEKREKFIRPMAVHFMKLSVKIRIGWQKISAVSDSELRMKLQEKAALRWTLHRESVQVFCMC